MILFFTIEGGPKITGGQDKDFSPGRFISNCVERAIGENVDLILPRGGFLEDRNTIGYNGLNISYLCLNKGNYEPCINQHPNYIKELKDELMKNSRGKMEGCFDSLKKEVTARNGKVEDGDMNLKIDFAKNRIFLNLTKKIVIDKGGQVERFEDFKIEIVNPLYNLAIIAGTIANNEAKFCYFEYVGYNTLYTKTVIGKTTMDDGTKIYSIKDKNSDKILNVAIRGCTIPPGI